MAEMSTVSEVLNELKKEGYDIDFNLKESCLECNGNFLQIAPDEFVVDNYYRFEGTSDPGDEAIVYAISSTKHNLKGTLVNGYGIYSDRVTSEMIKALQPTMAQLSGAQQPVETEEKHNDATPQRPAGDRVLDAPFVEMDLNAFRKQIKEEKAWHTSDRNAITIFKTDGLRLVLIALHKGAELKTHTAAGKISVQVLEGEVTFATAEQEASLTPGQMVALHEGIPHSVHAHQESVFLLTLTTTSVGK